jgi:hypothetical protein
MTCSYVFDSLDTVKPFLARYTWRTRSPCFNCTPIFRDA